MISKLLLLFVFITPLFGKTINYSETIIFYIIPSIIFWWLLFSRQKIYFSKKAILIQIILIFLFLVSIIFSKNIGSSYYQFFAFLNIIITISVALNILKPKEFLFGVVISSLLYSIVFLLNKANFLPITKDLIGDNFILQVWGHSYLSDLLVLSIPILINKITTKKNYHLLMVLLIIFTSLILTNSRSSLVALIIGLLFLKVNISSIVKKIIKTSVIIISLLGLFFIFNKIHFDNQNKQKTFDGNRVEYWSQAIKGFKESPLLGYGPGTFSLINQKYKGFNNDYASFAHNSFLNYLAENGLIFTIIFFGFTIFSLFETFKINNLFFVCGMVSLVNSLLDPTWSSPGIFIISLYFIFYYPFLRGQKQSGKLINIYFFIFTALILFFTVSKLTSDILFLTGNYKKSVLIDPFNLNSRLAIIQDQKKLSTTLVIFNNEIKVYKKLIEIVPLPRSESYYYKVIELNPKENVGVYVELANFYKKNKSDQKFNEILNKIDNTFVGIWDYDQKIVLSKFYYYYALDLFSINTEKSIRYFEKTVYLVPTFGYFQVDLVNAYWHSNQKEKAINQLEKCLEYPDPRKQCQGYLDKYRNKEFNKPGSKDFLDYIEKI